ncbi:transcription initiation factor TFIID subunit 10-like [Nymphalis io]|uniref:Transcription initiation factor TFIID subunit 10-like isoform X1 n=2 Tax=Vanessa tameamea TaxID=334116 RepID=A0A8B8HUU7_VANTA|nr:transcription initiation factor TFIID subunit 10-like isoform X1 [Vanessa tameamea]XP_046975632.1 transcription initiation factor TFIID subunit 10-like isoform X1 [Vanessa cardui]XP_047542327.1 transcription initiation factor TFIID subunit 10-like isoform X1 [Vanessa atalanta]XP_050359801.1 transcription initiation factor TFIID subunit 10-like [Nymphalis io]
MQMSRMSSPSIGMDEDSGAGHALTDFLLQLENYSPSIPDSVVAYYLNMSGFESQDPRLIRLIALASQKFLSDIANDALQHCKMRTSSQINQSSKNQKGPKEKKYVMTMEDLVPALQEYGISAKKPHYFV